jgi:glycogen debranching enzyme
MPQITTTAYNKAIEVLKSCARSIGFYASGLPGGYEGLWSRDSMTSTLGACLVGNEFKDTIEKSIATLAKNQAELGQIPNAVGIYNNDRKSDITFNSLDSSLWFIIGNFVFAKQFKDKTLLARYEKKLELALTWIRSQDPDNLGLVAQQPTNDWQDAFPHKYGYTIHIHSLFYAALHMMGKSKRAITVKRIINGQEKKYSSLWNDKLGYYYPWGWKNHDNIREHEEWFDTAGNLLAIITGLATPEMASRILKYIEKQKINKPYPCKAIWPPILRTDPEWHDYFELCDARDPLSYLNGGIWPFIGGLYVVALVKMKEFTKAQKELEKLAKANMQIIQDPGFPEYTLEISKSKNIPVEELKKMRQKEFNEWLHGKTGEPKGEPYQAWSAGTYLYAYECLKKRKVLFF